jgi:hypothetical protein
MLKERKYRTGRLGDSNILKPRTVSNLPGYKWLAKNIIELREDNAFRDLGISPTAVFGATEKVVVRGIPFHLAKPEEADMAMREDDKYYFIAFGDQPTRAKPRPNFDMVYVAEHRDPYYVDLIDPERPLIRTLTPRMKEMLMNDEFLALESQILRGVFRSNALYQVFGNYQRPPTLTEIRSYMGKDRDRAACLYDPVRKRMILFYQKERYKRDDNDIVTIDYHTDFDSLRMNRLELRPHFKHQTLQQVATPEFRRQFNEKLLNPQKIGGAVLMDLLHKNTHVIAGTSLPSVKAHYARNGEEKPELLEHLGEVVEETSRMITFRGIYKGIMVQIKKTTKPMFFFSMNVIEKEVTLKKRMMSNNTGPVHFFDMFYIFSNRGSLYYHQITVMQEPQMVKVGDREVPRSIRRAIQEWEVIMSEEEARTDISPDQKVAFRDEIYPQIFQLVSKARKMIRQHLHAGFMCTNFDLDKMVAYNYDLNFLLIGLDVSYCHELFIGVQDAVTRQRWYFILDALLLIQIVNLYVKKSSVYHGIIRQETLIPILDAFFPNYAADRNFYYGFDRNDFRMLETTPRLVVAKDVNQMGEETMVSVMEPNSTVPYVDSDTEFNDIELPQPDGTVKTETSWDLLYPHRFAETMEYLMTEHQGIAIDLIENAEMIRDFRIKYQTDEKKSIDWELLKSENNWVNTLYNFLITAEEIIEDYSKEAKVGDEDEIRKEWAKLGRKISKLINTPWAREENYLEKEVTRKLLTMGHEILEEDEEE